VTVTQGVSVVGVADWPVTVGVVEVGVVDTRHRVSQPGADAERYRCACLHCTHELVGRGEGVLVCIYGYTDAVAVLVDS